MLKTPPMQTATATIDNYCSRLQSATLLEDRRAAIEGLRSVAKQYPASVASGSLRELILTLRRDGIGEVTKRRDGDAREGGGDVDTIRLVLETLVRLFEPEPDSPEAGEEIALFLADEFCMRQENTSLLLDLLDPTAPYSDNLSCKLSVQILSAICAARPERLQEAILGAPLGVSRLVGVLDNARDDVRYAGLELLTHLTGGANEELRKIVAFEDVFGRVFALIQLEGGLAEARIVVQDCLTLLINLVKGSVSNQTMFRESGCISQLAELLKEVFPSEETEPAFVVENRVRGGWGLLQLLRQLLITGEPSTPQNQSAFFRAGIAQILVSLAFHQSMPPLVKESALRAVADLIRANAPIQVNFASTQVEISTAKKDEPPNHLQSNGTQSKESSARNSGRPSLEKQPVYIIEALLSLMLRQQRVQRELRTAACAVVQAYLSGHLEIRAHFLQRAIAGHKEREEAPNVLTSLLHTNEDDTSVILSGWTVQDLVASNREAKTAFADIKEGEASEGEDVLTSISTLGAQLQQSILQKSEPALIAAHATTLCILLWDFADGIDDFLAEGSSTIQALVDSVKSDSAVVAGLAATLLGIIYEFSTKDSPIPRKTLASLLTQKLGRDRYLTALYELRSDPAIRDYDLPLGESNKLELSESFFSLFLNEYPRLRRAIDKDPGIEVLPYAAAEAGVQRDVLDELRNKITNLESSLSQQQQASAETSQQAQQDKLQTEQRLTTLQKESEQEKSALQKELRTATTEVERIRAVITKLQASHEDEGRKAQQQRQRELEEANVRHARELAGVRQEAERKAQQAKHSAEQGFVPVRQDFERKLAELGNSHRTEQAGHTAVRGQLEALTSKHAQIEKQLGETSQQHKALTTKHSELERSTQQLEDRVTKAETDLAAARKAVDSNDAAVDAMNAQIAELQEELQGRDRELMTERAGYADLEKELESERMKSSALEQKLAVAERTVGELEAKVQDLQTKHNALLKDVEQSKSDAKTNGTKTNKKDADASKKTETLKKLSDSLADEVKKLKAECEAAKKREASQEEALQASQKSVSAAQEAEKSAKEELDNLLLVMSDIEVKRDEYRARIKELGGEVSEDDDEDDEDEEEDINDDVD